MPLTSGRASNRVVSSSLISVALLIFLVATTLPKNNVGIPRNTQQGRVSPHMKYRAHEVVVGTEGQTDRGGLKKFVLQEGTAGTGSGSSASELSWRNLSVKEVAGLWKSKDGEFVETFISSIKEIAAFEAVFFESKPVTRNTMVRLLHTMDLQSRRGGGGG